MYVFLMIRASRVNLENELGWVLNNLKDVEVSFVSTSLCRHLITELQFLLKMIILRGKDLDRAVKASRPDVFLRTDHLDRSDVINVVSEGN